MSVYDPIARLYDPWSASVIEDISFYVDLALAAGGPVVELGVGTGRVAIPTAMAGVHVIGVDSSAGMLAVCGENYTSSTRNRTSRCTTIVLKKHRGEETTRWSSCSSPAKR